LGGGEAVREEGFDDEGAAILLAIYSGIMDRYRYTDIDIDISLSLYIYISMRLTRGFRRRRSRARGVIRR